MSTSEFNSKLSSKSQGGISLLDLDLFKWSSVRCGSPRTASTWTPRLLLISATDRRHCCGPQGTEKAQEATRSGALPQIHLPGMKSTTLNAARSKRGTTRGLPEKVGMHSKRVDAALPGKHTRKLYDQLSWKEASVLAQLRTGMARLNTYLFRIKATTSDQCTCGQARETVEHFLLRCRKWTEFRTEMLRCTETHRSNISFYLGGKSPSDNKDWKPHMEAVRATIRFAIATGRLDADLLPNETP